MRSLLQSAISIPRDSGRAASYTNLTGTQPPSDSVTTFSTSQISSEVRTKMTPFAAVAVKTLSAAGVAALLSVGAMSALAASPSPKPTPTAAGTQQAAGDRHADRRAIRRVVVEAEADLLGIKPEQLIKDLKAGQKVSDLAKDKGMTKEQFDTKLVANLKPRLEVLVDHKTITQAQADRALDRIAKGYVPFWDGIHRRK